jgi:hypothetical protein
VTRAKDEVIAVHESGHVVLSLHCGLGVSLATIDRDPRDTANEYERGITYHTTASDWLAPYVEGKRTLRPVGPARRATVLSHLLVCWGGAIAEKLLLGRSTWRQHTADAHGAQVYSRMLGHHARAVPAVVASFRRPAQAILESRLGELTAITGALMRHRTLTGAHLRGIVARERAWDAKARRT